MRLRLLSLACALGLLATFVAAPLAASAAQTTTNPLKNIPVTGTTGNGGTFTGALSITSFAVQNGNLVANGILTGTAVDPVLGTQQVNTPVTLPAAISGSCRILDLTLGPLHLDLLGLVIDLNQVHLTITAQQGPGNLLGNLLCAVANLLNSNASGTALNQIVNLLNQILATL
jgi:hypothetical protein